MSGDFSQSASALNKIAVVQFLIAQLQRMHAGCHKRFGQFHKRDFRRAAVEEHV